MQKLTEHFTLEEMISSTTADKYGIKNTPTKQQISELTRLCKDVLEPIRQKLGKPITVTSGFRCKTLNHYIGGEKNNIDEMEEIINEIKDRTQIIKSKRDKKDKKNKKEKKNKKDKNDKKK